MNQRQQSRWRLTRRQLLVAGGVAAAAFVFCSYLFGWHWTGLPRLKVPPNVQPTKTLWDWLDLLIVPVVLAIGGYLFNRSETRAAEAAAERRAQDEALQAYLDQIGQLLLDNALRQSKENSDAITLARARTLTVLSRLDGNHKARVVQFLYESGLITKDNVIVDLNGADLRKTNLSKSNLFRADLSKVDLPGANLSKAFMNEAKLLNAGLFFADRWNRRRHPASEHPTS